MQQQPNHQAAMMSMMQQHRPATFHTVSGTSSMSSTSAPMTSTITSPFSSPSAAAPHNPHAKITFHYANVSSYASPAASASGAQHQLSATQSQPYLQQPQYQHYTIQQLQTQTQTQTQPQQAQAQPPQQQVPEMPDPLKYFVAGQQYLRQDIHEVYKAQRKGPVASPHDSLAYTFLFTRLRPSKDATSYWKDNTLYYIGEGKTGDMEWKGGNKVLRESPSKGKKILAFTYVERVAGAAVYEGEVELQGIDQIDEPDREGIMRKAFLFKLAPVGGWTHEDTVPITGSASRKRKPEATEQSTEPKGMMTRAKKQELEMLQQLQQQHQQQQQQQAQQAQQPPASYTQPPADTNAMSYSRLTPQHLQQLAAGINPFPTQAQPQQQQYAPMHMSTSHLQPVKSEGQQQSIVNPPPALPIVPKQEPQDDQRPKPVDQVVLLAMMREAMMADKRAEELELCHAKIVNALLHEPGKYVIQ